MKIHFFKNGSIAVTLNIRKLDTNCYQKSSYFFENEFEYKKFILDYKISM